MKIIQFQKFISSILILQLIVPVMNLSVFNPISVSDDNISDDLSWTKVWKENYGWVSSIAIDSFNNIWVLRSMSDLTTDEEQYFLTKLNNSGDFELEVPLEYIGDYCIYHTIKIDASNNIYIAGYYDTQEDGKYYMLLLRYDIMGNQIWNKTWGGLELFLSSDMDIDILGNIYLVGSARINQSNNYGIYLVKFNNSGTMLWNHTWGGNFYDIYYALAIDSNDFIYIAGSSNFNSTLIKYNSSGLCEWNYTWNGYSNEYDLTIDNEGKVLVASDHFVVKLNSNGFPLWNFTINSIIGSKIITDSLNNIYIAENRFLPCYDNFFFVASSCICTSIYLEKVSSSGFFIWEKRCTGCGSASCSDIAIDSIENIYISGQLHNEFGCKTPLNDAILMKNPKNFEGVCIEIYYDLLFLIAVPIAINVLIVIIIFIKRNRRKRTVINS